ncbi:MAG: porin [Ramlibacter sp.]
MKKTFTVLAVFAAGAASAQSSVTLFGIVDATFAHGSGSVASKTQLTNSGYNSSRLGFKGTEDLGGGLAASFWLEGSALTDTGAGGATSTNNQTTGSTGGGGLTFNRRSTVSLSGAWGEVRLGRDYTPQFWNLAVFDPFGTNGVGTTQVLGSTLGGPVAVRASNTMGYFLPRNLGGFYGQVQHYLGENLSNAGATEKDGRGTSLRLGYAKGPVNVALSHATTKYAAGDIRSTSLGGLWNFGVAKLMAEYSRDRVGAPASTTGTGGLIGGVVPVGAGEVRLAYSSYKVNSAGNPKSTKWALGYVHHLSKRTVLYTTFARVNNSGGASRSLNGAVTAANNSSSGYDFGVRHSF